MIVVCNRFQLWVKKDVLQNSVPVFLLVVSIFFCKPLSLGFAFSDFGGLIAFISALLIVFLNWHVRIDAEKKRILRYIAISYVPVFLSNIYTGQYIMLKAALIVFLTSISFSVVFSYGGTIGLFFRVLRVVFLLLIISSIITFSLHVCNGNAIDHVILEIPVKNRSDFDTLKFLYPFSPMYSVFTTVDFVLLRFSYFFIEAGIVSGVFASLVIWTLYSDNSKLRVIIILLFFIGGVLTFSTSCLPAFALGIYFYYLSRRDFSVKILLLTLIAFVIVFYLFKKIPYIGFDDKSETHGASFDERLGAYSFVQSNLVRYVTLISSLFLFLKLYLIRRDKLVFLSLMLPLIFTGIMNNLFFSPILFAFCYLDTDNINVGDSSIMKVEDEVI